MIRVLIFITIVICLFPCCHQKQLMTDATRGDNQYKASNAKTALTCKMLPEELRLRKETVLASLKSKMLDRKELPDGYAFKFPGSDQVVDELFEFIKTERECCDFFVFNLSVSGDKSEAWLVMTGVEGAKDFITQELGL